MKSLAKVSLRKVTFSDIEFLWYLRNRQNVYRYSKNNRPVKWEEHINWILPIISGVGNKDLFVVRKGQTSIGQIRFDYQSQDETKISISTLKEFRKKGFATKSLDLAIKKIRKLKKIKFLIAEIHKKNLPSIKLFEKLGFKFKTEEGSWLKYILNL